MKKGSGFTLLELLVVITIIGMLASLILPAVTAARESARRITCVNHQKQIGLALHGYCEARGVFPAAWVGFELDEKGKSRPAPLGPTGWGWGAALLPYIEQENLQASYVHYDLPVCDADNEAAIGFPLRLFRCPSDSGHATFTLDEFLQSHGAVKW